LTVMVIGVRNAPGISFQRWNNQYIKCMGQVGQELIESIFSFVNYRQLAVTQIVKGDVRSSQTHQNGLINLGWRGWEGDFPSPI
ncbi:hypothetical protein, partial [Pseudomonas sp. 2822-17]|uniref:hypothetical protein n=1 Tax=Pseudomonas sp. 2822-17 TaxID=1712678 RepID=UPI001C47A4F2